MPELSILSPSRVASLAVGRPVHVTGAGRRNIEQSVSRFVDRLSPGSPLALAGLARGLDPGLRAGHIVVATAARTADGSRSVALASGLLVAAELERAGLAVRTGTVVSASGVNGAGRARPIADAGAGAGAVAFDTEAGWLAGALGARRYPLAVVHAVVDGTDEPLLTAWLHALHELRRVRGPLERWAAAAGPRRILLAGPRSFCAGVDRAIDVVERALARYGTPVFVRRQIVHNTHVVRDLEAKGAVFVEELDQVPPGATVVLAAHGVAPEVRAEADQRGLRVIDATCPLVAKVHHEAQRFAERGYDIVLIGHGDHEEVIGTVGEAPGVVHLVERGADIDTVAVRDPHRVAYLTQTTLATDETAELVGALRERFPAIVGPRSDDICYATQNRQDAVRALARECDVVLVVGSRHSSNSNRLAEVAVREGARAYLLEDHSELELDWLPRATTIGITAGASAPEALVGGIIGALEGLGPVEVEERTVTAEDVRFTLPPEVR